MSATTNAAGDLIELLQAWMTMNRVSPLDGTISCRHCRALVLETNAEGHYSWHDAYEQS